MDLQLTAADRYTVLAVIGRVTAPCAARLQRAIADVVADGSEVVIVDLSCTEAIEFSGLSSLVVGLKAARLAGGDLRIAAPSAAVSHALRTSQLHHVLREHAAPEHAIGTPETSAGHVMRRGVRRSQPVPAIT